MAGLAKDADKIDRLLRKKDFKSAIYRAKEIHKKRSDRDSEELVIRAYSARIRDFIGKKLLPEAKSMIDMVQTLYPSSASGMAELREQLTCQNRTIEERILLLDDPALSVERREQIEMSLRRDLTDVTVIMKSGALPEHHPQKQAAGAVWAAFSAVTSGPIDETCDDPVSLEMISRRSFLSDWKMLVRAIASYYRQEDETCGKFLSMIHPASAAAKLSPVLRSLLAGQPSEKLGGAALSLCNAVLETDDPFRESLDRLDRYFETNKRKKILREVKKVLPLCQAFDPELVERLKQHISIRCSILTIPVSSVMRAMGGPSLHDAYFFRLLARMSEQQRDLLPACSFWENFRWHGLAEQWFTAGSLEESIVYRHMLELFSKIPTEFLREECGVYRLRYDGNSVYYDDQPKSIQSVPPKTPDPYFTDPAGICERICRNHPDAEIYRQWVDWISDDPKRAVTVAEAWRKAFPEDSRPLIVLMKQAEERGAIHKAIKYLEKAEAIDGVNSEVRFARWRLWSRSALRHLTQKKPNLARKDIAELEVLPQSKEENSSILLCAFRWLCSLQEKQDDQAICEIREEMERITNDPLLSLLVVSGLGDYCKYRHDSFELPKAKTVQADNLLSAVVRLLKFEQEVELTFKLPRDYLELLWTSFEKDPQAFDSKQLILLALLAKHNDFPEIEYNIVAAGIARHDATLAKFLFMRVTSFPDWIDEGREEDCAMAAYLTARRLNDANVMSEASKYLYDLYLSPPSPSMMTDFIWERVDSIIQYEIDQKEYPNPLDNIEDEFDGFYDEDEDEWDEAEWDEDDDDDRDEVGDAIEGQNYLPFWDLEEKPKKGKSKKNEDEKCMCPECRYQRGEISRADYQKLLDASIPDMLPKDVQQMMDEFKRKVGSANPTRKQLDALMARDPLFVARVIAILGKYGFDDYSDFTGSGR